MTLSTIDPKAGTHFTGEILVTNHACERAVEYFGIERRAASTYVADMLRKSALIDDCIIGENAAKPTRLYAHKGFSFVVDSCEDKVVTIYPRKCAAPEIRDNVGKTLKRLLSAAQRTETRELRRLSIERAEIAVQIAELNLKLLRSNLTTVKRKVNAEIARLNDEVARIDAEMLAVRREKTTIANGICAFV